MIREVVSLDMLVIIGEVTTCGRSDKRGIRGMKSGTRGSIVN